MTHNPALDLTRYPEPEPERWHDHTTDAHAEWTRRLAEAADHPDEPAYAEAAHMADPRAHVIDIPDRWLTPRDEFGDPRGRDDY